MCVFIFAMSSAPADESTELSMGFVWQLIELIVPGYDQMPLAEQLYWQNALDHIVRKTAHFCEYAALGALALNMLRQWMRMRKPGNAAADDAPRWQAPALAWGIATLYAATDEFHQIFVDGRSGMPTDVLLDSTGALTGVFLAFGIFRIIDKRRRSVG